MALSSNSIAGSTKAKVGAEALSNLNTENKSNGNFSGGDINFDTSKLSNNNPFDTKEPQQPTFNTDDVFKPTLSGNLDIDLPKTNNNSSSSSNTTYSNDSTEPTMTVDEVYRKSNNQPVVKDQEAFEKIGNLFTQMTENFELKADEVDNLDNWLEGSGSNTASNEKFNQSLTYDEWLRLIEADPTMREFAKSLTEKKKDKNAQKDNADAGVNS